MELYKERGNNAVPLHVRASHFEAQALEKAKASIKHEIDERGLLIKHYKDKSLRISLVLLSCGLEESSTITFLRAFYRTVTYNACVVTIINQHGNRFPTVWLITGLRRLYVKLCFSRMVAVT